MGGWGRGIMNITPQGRVLPCHAAESIPGLEFDNVRDKPSGGHLAQRPSLPEVPRHRLDEGAVPELATAREIDFGGCRCQAFAMTGDATNTDPACSLSPRHAEFAALAQVESGKEPPPFIYRRMGKPLPAS